MKKHEIENLFDGVIDPLESFMQILTDLEGSPSAEGNDYILFNLNQIFKLVHKNTKEKLDELRPLTGLARQITINCPGSPNVAPRS